METNNSIIWLSALSGLSGALLTQLMTGLFGYMSDRRKQKTELASQYRGKRTEIGENFYFMHGELMAMIKKNVAYWKNSEDFRSDATRLFLKQEMDRLDKLQIKLQTENWKYNLVGIYYDIPYTFPEMLDDNRVSHELYLSVLDHSENIRKTLPQERVELYPAFEHNVTQLIAHYENVYMRMEQNMNAVKKQLLQHFRGI
jgi:hypothetical protein